MRHHGCNLGLGQVNKSIMARETASSGGAMVSRLGPPRQPQIHATRSVSPLGRVWQEQQRSLHTSSLLPHTSAKKMCFLEKGRFACSL